MICPNPPWVPNPWRVLYNILLSFEFIKPLIINSIEIYTDGSCHTEQKTGAWAAIILFQERHTVLKGIETNTTHNRMEMQAVINALEYLKANMPNFSSIKIFSDSQYVVGIPDRKVKLIQQNFLTKKGNSIQNSDLIRKLIEYLEAFPVELIKVKAHQKANSDKNYNREVDKLVRQLLRNEVAKF